MVGSSVANSRSSDSTPASVRVLSNVDLPALVYPTMVTAASPLRSRWASLQPRVLADFDQLAFEPGDAGTDPAPLDFELGLAAAEPGADAAALLRQSGLGAPAQARQAVAQQRQLDLRLALRGPGVLGEDVEDHRRAVDRGTPQQLLQVVLLGRGQLVVEDDGVGVDGEAQFAQFFGLALADEEGVVRVIARLHQPAHLVGAGRVDQRRQFVEAGVGVLLGRPGERDPDQHDAFTETALDQGGAQRLVVGSTHEEGMSIVAM